MDLADFRFEEHPGNPLISPEPPGFMIADPTVLLPEETPDERWHLFANSIPPRLHHFVSNDGLAWKRRGTLLPGAMRPFVRRFEGRYHLYYERVLWPAPLRSRIEHCVSEDLTTWSDADVILSACLPWHGRLHRTCGNPCVVPCCGKYLLYYSAATVFLRDCLFMEPAFIGLAHGPSPAGPFRPFPEPLLSPSKTDALRNLGAGSIKVLLDPDGNGLWGFNNGIFQDGEGHSRSAVVLLRSDDGVAWRSTGNVPLLAPSGSGWKRALVYALDVRLCPGGEVLIYFNARDGWLIGRERIGLAVGSPCGPSA